MFLCVSNVASDFVGVPSHTKPSHPKMAGLEEGEGISISPKSYKLVSVVHVTFLSFAQLLFSGHLIHIMNLLRSGGATS